MQKLVGLEDTDILLNIICEEKGCNFRDQVTGVVKSIDIY